MKKLNKKHIFIDNNNNNISVGRPTEKDKSKVYIKVGVKIDDDVRLKMKQMLYTDGIHNHKTQDEFVETAIKRYINYLEEIRRI